MGRVVRILNIPLLVCDLCLGDRADHSHRMLAGVATMCAGVFIAKGFGSIHSFGIHYLADIVGFLIHGMGAVPFFEAYQQTRRVHESHVLPASA